MTLGQLRKIFPDACEETWHRHPNGGGWVQNTATVSETAFVGKGALVYGNARVSGNALVYGDARVYGDAWVSGNALVYGDAQVYGGNHAVSPFYWQGPKHSLTLAEPGVVRVGCLEFGRNNLESIAEKGRRHGYTEAEIDLYKRMILIALEESDRRWPATQEADRG